jgi:hypothetical protein
MNTTCDVCKAPLGTKLVEGSGTSSKPKSALVISMLLTLAFCGAAWALKLHASVLLVAMFYGPLTAAYLARDNAVFYSALGGVLGVVAILVLSFVLSFDRAIALLAGAINTTPRVADGYGETTGTGVPIILAFGLAVAFITVLPFSLIGAAVGEVLAGPRRKQLEAALAPVAVPGAKLSDAELAKVQL